MQIFEEKKSNEIVDVIIPLYNCEKYIIEAIDSVLKQSYPINKIIVVDDGSTDNSAMIVEDLAIKFPNIALLKERHLGRSSARNTGISFSEAQYIAFLDSDDFWDERKIERQMSVFAANNAVDIIYSNYEVVDGQSKKIDSFHVEGAKLRGDVFKELLRENLVSGSSSSVIARAKAIKDVGGFDDQLSYGEDWDLWLKLAKKYQFDFVNDPIVKIRRLPTLSVNKYRTNVNRNKQLLMVWSKWTDEVMQSPCILDAINNIIISKAMTPAISVNKRFIYHKIAVRNYRTSLNQQIFLKMGILQRGKFPLVLILLSDLKRIFINSYHKKRHQFNLILRKLRNSYHQKRR